MAEPYSQTRRKEAEGEAEEVEERGRENRTKLRSELESGGRVLQERGSIEEGTKTRSIREGELVGEK